MTKGSDKNSKARRKTKNHAGFKEGPPITYTFKCKKGEEEMLRGFKIERTSDLIFITHSKKESDKK